MCIIKGMKEFGNLEAPTTDYLRKTMNIGKEPFARANSNESSRQNDVKERFRNWWIGLVISFIPLFAVPFSKLLSGKSSNLFFEVFSNYEIIYVGISLMIVTLNDFMSHSSKKAKNSWHGLNIALIVIGAVIYGLMAVTHYNAEVGDGTFDFSVAFWFNIIFLVIIILLGSIQYWCEMRRKTKKCKH